MARPRREIESAFQTSVQKPLSSAPQYDLDLLELNNPVQYLEQVAEYDLNSGDALSATESYKSEYQQQIVTSNTMSRVEKVRSNGKKKMTPQLTTDTPSIEPARQLNATFDKPGSGVTTNLRSAKSINKEKTMSKRKLSRDKSQHLELHNSYGSSNMNDLNVYNSIGVPSLNQAIFTNQAIQENQVNYERDNFVLKLQRSEEDIQLERMRGETLLIDPRPNTNHEMTEGTKTIQLDDTNTTPDMDTRDIDSPTNEEASKSKERQRKKVKVNNKLSKMKKRVVNLKKSTHKSSQQQPTTPNNNETINTLPIEAEDVTTIEPMSDKPAKANMFSIGSSYKDHVDHTFSYMLSDEGPEKLPKSKRDTLIKSSILQQKYGLQNLDKQISKEYQINQTKVKKIIKVDEDDRQKMIIATIGQPTPQEDDLEAPRILPREHTAGSDREQTYQPNNLQSITGSRFSQLMDAHNQNNRSRTMQSKYYRTQTNAANRVTLANLADNLDKDEPGNFDAFHGRETETNNLEQQQQEKKHGRKTSKDQTLSDGWSRRSSTIMHLVLSGTLKDQSIQPGSVHKSRRSLAKAVRVSGGGGQYSRQPAASQQRMSRRLLTAQFKVENQKHVRKESEVEAKQQQLNQDLVVEPEERVKRTRTLASKTRNMLKANAVNAKANISQSKDLLEQLENQRKFLNKKVKVSEGKNQSIKRVDEQQQYMISTLGKMRQSKLLKKNMVAKSALRMQARTLLQENTKNFEIVKKQMMNPPKQPAITTMLESFPSQSTTSAQNEMSPKGAGKTVIPKQLKENLQSIKSEIMYQDQSKQANQTRQAASALVKKTYDTGEKEEDGASESSSAEDVKEEKQDQSQEVIKEVVDSNEITKQSLDEKKTETIDKSTKQRLKENESHIKIDDNQYVVDYEAEDKLMDSNLESMMQDSLKVEHLEDEQVQQAQQKETVAVTIDQKIRELLDKTELNESDLITEDELLKLKFDRINEVYLNIQRNQKRFGYTKSPDYNFKSELLQRQKEKTWMASRGKTPEARQEKQLLRNNLDIVKVRPSAQKYGLLNKNDLECYFDPEMEKTNEKVSQDFNNSEIIQFCTYLFHAWLDDYRQYAEMMMKRNLTYHHHSLQQTVEQNIADKCIPMDYFIERMLQIGICSTMSNLRKFIDLMLKFDNSGFGPRGPDNMPSYIGTPLNQSEIQSATSGSARASSANSLGEKKRSHQKPLTQEEYDRVPWEQPFSQDFMPMNYPSRETAKFLSRHLAKTQFHSDRISLSQFLSLFNVIGVGNAKKLDKLTQYLKKEASEYRLEKYVKDKVRAKIQKQKELKKSINQKLRLTMAREYEYQQMKLVKLREIKLQKDQYIRDLRQNVTPIQRKLTGVLMENINKQSLLKRQVEKSIGGNEGWDKQKLHFTNSEFSQKDRSDETFYQGVMNEFKRASNVVDFLKDYERQTKSQELDNILADELDDEMKNGGSLINPTVLLETIKGKDQEIMNRKSQNLWKLLYGNTRIEEQNDLRYKWQDDQYKENKNLISKKLRQIESMPQVIEEDVDHQFSRSQSSMHSEQEMDEQHQQMIMQFSQKQEQSYIEQLNQKSQDQENSKNDLEDQRRTGFLPYNFVSQTFNQSKRIDHKRNQRTSQMNPQKLFVKQYTFNEKTINDMKREAELEKQKVLDKQLDNKYKQELQRAQNQLDIIRKQMIAVEICKDLQKMQMIIAGLLQFDSTNKINNKFDRAVFLADEYNSGPHGQSISSNKPSQQQRPKSSKKATKKPEVKKPTVGSTLTRNEALEKRQKYRKMFSEFIMVGIREKYSKQLGLFYAGDEDKLGKNIKNGATMDMMRDPKDYGIQARTHLLKIASLMVRHNIKLTRENFKDPCHYPKTPKDKPRGTIIGVLGWLIDLSQVEEIRNEMNMLINMVLEQIHDRDNTFSYPNEDIETLINAGEQKWSTEIDPINELTVPRRCVDTFLCKNKICADYKQVNRFLSGVLSGTTILQHEDIKKNQFMKVIMKAALRECIRNIITYNKFGFDQDFITLNHGQRPQASVPFSHQILRFQRYILFCGIKTKNSRAVPIKDRQDYLERSQACSNIVTNLQDMKQNKQIINADSCKIELETFVQDYKKKKEKFIKETGILNDLTNSQEWDAYIASNPDKAVLFESFQRFQGIYNKNQPEHLANLQAEAYKKHIYRGLIDSKECIQKETKMHDASLFSPKNGAVYLPQVKAAMRVKTNKQSAEVAKLIHQQQHHQLDHEVNQYFFGEPDHFVMARKMQTTTVPDMCSSHDKLDPLGEFTQEEEVENEDDGASNRQDGQNEQKRNGIPDQYESVLPQEESGRVSLVERQTFRSQIGREMLKKAILLNK